MLPDVWPRLKSSEGFHVERCAQSELGSTWNTLLVRLCMYAGIWAMGESSLVFLELRPRGAGVVRAGRQGDGIPAGARAQGAARGTAPLKPTA